MTPQLEKCVHDRVAAAVRHIMSGRGFLYDGLQMHGNMVRACGQYDAVYEVRMQL